MKQYWIQHKHFLFFLCKFSFTYLLLSFLYQSYLNTFDISKYEVDGFTRLVAQQTKSVLVFFNIDAATQLHASQSCVQFFYNKKYVARIVEGCNALSVIILFVAFVIAFKGKWKHTFLFVIGGSILIHVLNVTRIAILSVALYYFPEREPFLHGVLFPFFIYGVVFVLWVIWVNKFSVYAKDSISK